MYFLLVLLLDGGRSSERHCFALPAPTADRSMIAQIHSTRTFDVPTTQQVSTAYSCEINRYASLQEYEYLCTCWLVEDEDSLCATRHQV